MRLLELFSGTGSVGRVFRDRGWEVTSPDVRFEPTIKQDILQWDYKKHAAPGHYDFVWASPPCTHFSRARTTGGPRGLAGADALARRALDVIDYFAPPAWLLENPATGLLRTRDVVRGLPFVVVTYCSYGFPYRKPTILFGHLPGWRPRPTCFQRPCEAKRALGYHPATAQRGPRLGRPGSPLTTLYALPGPLCEEICEAVEVNARAAADGPERGEDPEALH